MQEQVVVKNMFTNAASATGKLSCRRKTDHRLMLL
jgi:hypothetical protein